MRFLRVAIVVLSMVVSRAISYELHCDFQTKYWENMGNVYTCNARDLTALEPNITITKVTGNHLEGKTNIDVTKLNIDGQRCNFLPQGFEKFFPNLEGLRVARSSLIELKQSDIDVFPKLVNCDMFYNSLEALDRNLFEKNPNLEYLYFGDNRIRSVGYNILKPLKKAHKVIFQGNSCIHKNADYDHEIPQLQRALNEKCSTFSEEEARKLDEYEEELQSEAILNPSFVWTFAVLSTLALVAVAFFLLKKGNANKSRDTESVTGILPAYNEMYPSAPMEYENGSTNLSRSTNNQSSCIHH